MPSAFEQLCWFIYQCVDDDTTDLWRTKIYAISIMLHIYIYIYIYMCVCVCVCSPTLLTWDCENLILFDKRVFLRDRSRVTIISDWVICIYIGRLHWILSNLQCIMFSSWGFPPFSKGHWQPLAHPDSKVHGANMGPIWGRQDPGGPHVGPMNFAIWAALTEGVWAMRRDGDRSCLQ